MAATACSFDHPPTNGDVLDCVFGYIPSDAPAGLFLALFFLAAQASLYVAVSRRSLLYAFIAQCCLAEMGGYVARLVVIGSFTTSGYIAMTVLLLITPSLLAIANYHLLAQLLNLSESADTNQSTSTTTTVTTSPTASLVESIRSRFSLRRHLANFTKPRQADGRINAEFASSLFTVLAITTAVIQGVGIGKLSDPSATQAEVDSGDHLIIAGLSLALFTYLCFFAIAFYTYCSPHYDFHTDQSPAMHRLFLGITTTQAVLAARTLYRLVQYALGSGRSNVVTGREWCFYVFDASLVVLCVVLFVAFDQKRSVERAQQELQARRVQKATPV